MQQKSHLYFWGKGEANGRQPLTIEEIYDSLRGQRISRTSSPFSTAM